MNILGIIPARGGSKGIPQKNIYPLLGKPLLAYTIEAAHGSKLVTRTILSSDSPSIIQVAEEYSLEVPFVRPESLAQDDTPSLPMVKHTVQFLIDQEDYYPDYIVLLQPTSPIRTASHIDEALQTLINSDADSLVSVVEIPHSCNPYSVMRLTKEGYLKSFLDYDETKNLRQLKPIFYVRNGAAIYAFTFKCLMDKNSLFGDRLLPYYMNKEDSIDIDDLLDMSICEYLLKRREEMKEIK